MVVLGGRGGGVVFLVPWVLPRFLLSLINQRLFDFWNDVCVVRWCYVSNGNCRKLLFYVCWCFCLFERENENGGRGAKLWPQWRGVIDCLVTRLLLLESEVIFWKIFWSYYALFCACTFVGVFCFCFFVLYACTFCFLLPLAVHLTLFFSLKKNVFIAWCPCSDFIVQRFCL